MEPDTRNPRRGEAPGASECFVQHSKLQRFEDSEPLTSFQHVGDIIRPIVDELARSLFEEAA